MLESFVEYTFAGLWGLLWHLGIAVGVAAIAGLLAWFSPVGKGLFVAICAAALALMGGEVIGIHLQKARTDAQAQIVQKDVDQAVAKTKTAKARASKDKWDSPRN